MAAAGKTVNNCSLPIGAKLGATVGMGAASLIAYKMVQNNVSLAKTQGNISMSAEKVSGNGSVSPKNNFVWENFLNNNSNIYENKTIYNISRLDVEQLQLDYHLQIIILYLLILVLIFLVIKFISDKNLKSNYIEKLPLNKFIKNIFTKIIKLWGNTSIVWVYILLKAVIICMVISIWSISIILSNIS